MKYVDMIAAAESANCLLCSNSPCSSVCPKGVDCAEIIRCLRFEDYYADCLSTASQCGECSGSECCAACTGGKINRPVDIKKLMSCAVQKRRPRRAGVDLTTEICGVKCENPFFLSSSVVCSNYEMVAKAFDMGWAGVAFKTVGMFIPNEASPRFSTLRKESNPFIGFKNIEQISDHPLEENLEVFRRLKRDYPSKVIIASVMGQNEDEWTRLARLCQESGADIIECNFSCPQMVGEGLGSDVGTNEKLVRRYTEAVRRGTTLPMLAKMTPNITDMTVPARAAVRGGADGIAAINTVKSIMNIDLESFISSPNVSGKSSVGGYSGKAVKPIALRFIYDMHSDPELSDIPISGMGGIETWRDAAEFISLGCSSVQITTSVMQYGYGIIKYLSDGLGGYMAEHNFSEISDFLGKGLENITDAENLDRDTLSYPRFDRENCVSCGRCYISCYDGGHQAIKLGKNNSPLLIASKCVGCHLCVAVCPTGSISPSPRVPKRNIKAAG